MDEEKIKVSIIVPFYYGNQYLERLFNSVAEAYSMTNDLACFEIIVVNDSPEEQVEIPESELTNKVIINEKNQGIQVSRVNGLNASDGEWIIFLDQDDEINPMGLRKQLQLTKEADVVVGNCKYHLGKKDIVFFKNEKEMSYLLQEERFFTIRNQIPSPGECLIRKRCIPNLWKKQYLTVNGADDWFLWILLFKNNARFTCNPDIVYVHNDADGNNLSRNLIKMRESAQEMRRILVRECAIDKTEAIKLTDAIDFKYYQDTRQLSLARIIRYRKTIIDNVRNRLIISYLQK